MHSAKRYLAIALSFAICMTVFATFAPRIAHAVTATLVQVVNTYSNPAAVTRADDPGRSVVRLDDIEFMQPGTLYSPQIPLNDVTTSAPYTVPAGKRLVVDSISAFMYPPTGQQPLTYLFNGGATPYGTFTAVPLVLQQSLNGTDVYVGFVPARDYVDPGLQYLVTISRSSATGGMFWDVQVVGHLVDCTNGGGC